MWHHQYLPQGGCPPRICPPPQQYSDPGHLPPQQQYSVPQDYLPQIHPPSQQYGAPSYPPPQQQYSSPQGGHPPQGYSIPRQYGAPGYPPLRQQYGAPQGDHSPQGFTLPQQHDAPVYSPLQQQYGAAQGGYPPQGFTLLQQQQYSAPQGGYPPQGFPRPQHYGAPGYPPPRQQYGAPQGYPPQQQQFSPLPGQYPPQQHSYGAPPPGQYGAPPPGPPPGQYGAPPLGQYVAPSVQRYGGGPPASHIRQVESPVISTVESEDAVSTSTHDSSPPASHIRQAESLATSTVESEDAMSTSTDESEDSMSTSTVESEDAMSTSTHDCSPLSETTGPCCYWCSRISLCNKRVDGPNISYDPLPDEREQLQKLFHSDCKCRRGRTKPPSSACGFCKHLDIRHLFRCVMLRDKSELPTFLIDWYRRENPQNGCRLCKYIRCYGIEDRETEFRFSHSDGIGSLVLPGAIIRPDHGISLIPGLVRQLQKYVDWERIEEWVPEKHLEVMDLPVDFRVIDVERNCIVTPGHPVRYVALSYVWGNSAQNENPFQASMRNIKDLEIEGSLSGAPLPRTITDAIEVCRQLGRQYLWVDRLCIIQDDESKHGQIQRMDSIFGSSEFTIVALSGQDANDGLPGVSKPRKSRRLKILKWQGITLTDIFPNLDSLVESSYWAKRGWTFQEQFCSKNNLYFTEYGVYCSRSHDEIRTERRAMSGFPIQMFLFPWTVEEYAGRSFTDPGDLLRAFIGVLNIQYGGRHHFGNAVPECSGYEDTFEAWITWQPVDWKYKARRPPKDISTKPVSHTQPHESDIFPSWSWTSVQGGVRFLEAYYGVALWGFPVAKGSRGIKVKWVSANWGADNLRKFTVEAGLMREGEFPLQPKHKSLEDDYISASSTLFKKADRKEAFKKLGRILSFAQVASLRLEGLDDHFCHDGRPTFQIMSSAGECMGGILLPKLSLEYIFNGDGRVKEKKFEFMALSFCRVRSGEDCILNSFGFLKDSNVQEVLNVMLIHYAKDSNVARRLGIGHVFEDKWLKERPVLKTIILE